MVATVLHQIPSNSLKKTFRPALPQQERFLFVSEEIHCSALLLLRATSGSKGALPSAGLLLQLILLQLPELIPSW